VTGTGAGAGAVTGTGAGAGAGEGSWGAWRAVLGVPPSLLLVLVGLVLGVWSAPGVLGDLRLGPSVPRLTRPSWEDVRTAAWSLALPQLPLTVLNSVVAVCQLSADLFPSAACSPSGCRCGELPPPPPFWGPEHILSH